MKSAFKKLPNHCFKGVGNMFNVKNAMKSDRLMKAITGMTVGEFLAILPVFSKIVYETAVSKERVRQFGGGAIPLFPI
jgi:hypothetical protein